jgi:CTP synthase (UTP-ammonia lyase)
VERTRIGIIGDFDAEYSIHRTTNAALEAAGRGVEVGLDYEWVATDSIAPRDARRLVQFDGLWAAPGGPYRSLDGALWSIRFARERGIPFVGT